MPELSEKTKAEQELGAKLAKENAAALERAEAARAAEVQTAQPDAPPEEADMAAATAEAEAAAIAQGKGFPHAKEPYQPKQRSK